MAISAPPHAQPGIILDYRLCPTTAIMDSTGTQAGGGARDSRLHEAPSEGPFLPALPARQCLSSPTDYLLLGVSKVVTNYRAICRLRSCVVGL